MILYLSIVILLLSVVFLLRIRWVMKEIRRTRSTGRWPRPFVKANNRGTTTNSKKNDDSKSSSSSSSSLQPPLPIKTLVVLGSGGHTTEMLALIHPLRDFKSSSCPILDIVYCKAESDTTSELRLLATTATTTNKSNKTKDATSASSITLYNIPRSREVGQSYVTSIYTTLHAFVWSVWLIVYQVRPQLLLCNGPGTCLPICVVVLLGRIFGFYTDCPIVFVESLCRVETLSLTGKLLYYFVDFFIVHWHELHQLYPQTTLCSSFIVPES